MHIFTEEQKAYIRAEAPGRYLRELTEMFNERFGLTLSESQLQSAKKRYDAPSGIDARFKKGHTNSKGRYIDGCEKGWFRKNHKPTNYKPLGTETYVPSTGYTKVKVAEPDVWEHKHRLVWKEHYGDIPDDSVIVFIDGDKRNFDISNLALIKRAEHAVMKAQGLKTGAEYFEISLLVAKVKMATAKAQKRIRRKRK